MKKFATQVRANVVTVMATVIIMAMGIGFVGTQPAQAAGTGALSSDEVAIVLHDMRSNVVASLSDSDKYSSLAGSEWDMLALARDDAANNKDLFEKYYSDISAEITEKGGTQPLGTTPTEYERVILALTAMGYDASDVAGYNLFDYISSYSNVMRQTINAAIFGLLAVSSNSSYKFSTINDSADQTTATKLIDFILNSEKADGGWALFGSVSDVDITGMTLQALAPYKGTSEDTDSRVTDAINRGIELLSQKQTDNGGYMDFYKEENACSQAQVVTALGSLGISFDDSRFVKGEHSTIENLMQFYLGSGNFMNKKSLGWADGMAQYQSYYALVAYQRALDGRNSLYNMNAESHTSTEGTDGTGTGTDTGTDQESTGTSTGGNTGNGGSTTGTTTENNAAQNQSGNNPGTMSTSSPEGHMVVRSFRSMISSTPARPAAIGTNGASATSSNEDSTESQSEDDDSTAAGDSDNWDFSADEYDAKADKTTADKAMADTTAEVTGMSAATIAMIVVGAAAVLGGAGWAVAVARKNAKASHVRE